MSLYAGIDLHSNNSVLAVLTRPTRQFGSAGWRASDSSPPYFNPLYCGTVLRIMRPKP